MRVGVFGGTFDPIHRGHVEPVLGIRRQLDLDRVLFVPTARPPHKSGERGASALQRFAMVELALLHHPALQVAPFEMQRDRPSYTVDTLEHLSRSEPDVRLVLIVGADSFVELPTWRRWRRILELAELGVMIRPGWSIGETLATVEPDLRTAAEGGRVHFVENRPVDLSSSTIREALRHGDRPPADAVDGQVLNYIDKYGLYRHDLGG